MVKLCNTCIIFSYFVILCLILLISLTIYFGIQYFDFEKKSKDTFNICLKEHNCTRYCNTRYCVTSGYNCDIFCQKSENPYWFFFILLSFSIPSLVMSPMMMCVIGIEYNDINTKT